MKTLVTVAVATAALVAGAANAADQQVSTTSQNISVNGVTFNSYNGTATGENTGSGSTAITTTRGDSKLSSADTGSLELHGDRSRYVIGSLYNYAGAPGFALTQLKDMTWDWNNAANGSNGYNAPVGRFTVVDNNNVRAELIWEYVEGNGGSTSATIATDQWNSTTAGGKWYANFRTGGTAGFYANNSNNAGYTLSDGQTGRVYQNGSQVLNALDDWDAFFSSNARVIGISFGAGSGFGAAYTGFVDNVAITTSGGTDRLNFNDNIFPAAVGDVPEPATWGMMLLGFGAVGVAARRRKGALAAA